MKPSKTEKDTEVSNESQVLNLTNTQFSFPTGPESILGGHAMIYLSANRISIILTETEDCLFQSISSYIPIMGTYHLYNSHSNTGQISFQDFSVSV